MVLDSFNDLNLCVDELVWVAVGMDDGWVATLYGPNLGLDQVITVPTIQCSSGQHNWVSLTIHQPLPPTYPQQQHHDQKKKHTHIPTIRVGWNPDLLLPISIRDWDQMIGVYVCPLIVVFYWTPAIDIYGQAMWTE